MFRLRGQCAPKAKARARARVANGGKGQSRGKGKSKGSDSRRDDKLSDEAFINKQKEKSTLVVDRTLKGALRWADQLEEVTRSPQHLPPHPHQWQQPQQQQQ